MWHELRNVVTAALFMGVIYNPHLFNQLNENISSLSKNLTYASQAKTGTDTAKTTPPPGSPEPTKKGK